MRLKNEVVGTCLANCLRALMLYELMRRNQTTAYVNAYVIYMLLLGHFDWTVFDSLHFFVYSNMVNEAVYTPVHGMTCRMISACMEPATLRLAWLWSDIVSWIQPSGTTSAKCTCTTNYTNDDSGVQRIHHGNTISVSHGNGQSTGSG